jgi:hypothetical protein
MKKKSQNRINLIKKNNKCDDINDKTNSKSHTFDDENSRQLIPLNRNSNIEVTGKSEKAPKELRLNTLKNCQMSLNRVIRAYWAGEIPETKARTMAHLLRTKFDAMSLTARLAVSAEIEELKKEMEKAGKLKNARDDEDY